jgi:Cupin superfamily protein
VYGPLPGCDLPSASSGDIARGALPEPVLEVTLKVGDVLFIPRGHVHEAVAQAEGSAHVTVSAYQQWTWMQMATSVLKACNVRSYSLLWSVTLCMLLF